MAELALNLDKQFVCIEYPAVVKNQLKMLGTLGGLDNITKTYNDSSKRLQLSFRPNNPFCQGVRGDREKSCAFLMKIRRKKVKNATSNASAKSDDSLSAEIIGVVPTTYKFKSIIDFQYSPMRSTHDGKHESILSNFLPNSIKTNSTFLQSDADLFIMPPLFSRIETPQSYQFRRPPHPRGAEFTSTVISKKRKFRGSSFKSWNFENIVPMEPDPASMEAISKEIFRSDHEKLISLFQERPIWSRNALHVILKMDRVKLKTILPAVAYYAVGGPWRGLWLRFGYNPKANPEAKMYQIVDFRVKQRYGGQSLNTSFKRISLENTLPNVKSKPKPSYSVKYPSIDDGNEDNDADHIFATTYGKKLHGIDQELVYKFKPGAVPPFRQMLFQLCDVESDAIQQQLHEDMSEIPDTCHSRNGWLSMDFLTRCRNQMNKMIEDHVTQTLSSDATKKLNVSESDVLADTEEQEFSDDGYENVMDSEMLELI